MATSNFHLAQANVGRIRAPLESPVMEGFTSQLERINALADRSPGFVWRLETEDGDATAIRPFPDELMLVNMSVWESLEALHGYVYRSEHVTFLRNRRDWFDTIDGPILVLWWIQAGHIPTVDEAKDKLDILARRGPSPDAFTFRNAFPPPGGAPIVTPEVDAEFCEPATR